MGMCIQGGDADLLCSIYTKMIKNNKIQCTSGKECLFGRSCQDGELEAMYRGTNTANVNSCK